MRTAARTDSNQKAIVAAFRKLGCSVLLMHQLGKGAPDCAVGKNNKTVLVEIKDGKKVPSAKKLTKDETAFQASWLGAVYVVEDLSDVIALVRGLER